MDKLYEACRQFLKQVEDGRAPPVKIIGAHVKRLRACGVTSAAQPELFDQPGHEPIAESPLRQQLRGEYRAYVEAWKAIPWQQRSAAPLSFLDWLQTGLPQQLRR